MRKTEQLRNQHVEILDVTRDISFFIRETTVANNIPDILTLLIRLSAKLKVHLSAEDKSLYPDMIAASDPRLSEAAKAFRDEMNGLSAQFESYMTQWRSSTAIDQDPETFKTDTAAFVGTLEARLKREESDLYPLADEI